MKFSTTRTAIAALATLGLTACGGGGGGDGSSGGGGNVTPQASTGFAEPGDQIRAQVIHDVGNTDVVSRTGSSLSRGDQTVTIRFAGTGLTQASLVIDGTEYDLQAPANGDNYTIDRNIGGRNLRIFFDRRLESGTNVAQAGDFQIINLNSGDRSYGAIAYGFDTDPDTVAALTGNAMTGNAVYSGNISARVLQGADEDRVSGDFDITANFNTNRVNGSFDVSAAAGILAATQYTLSEGTITGNGFSGTFSNDAGLSGTQTLQRGDYSGNFFGADGEAIAGMVTGTVTETGEDPVFIHGGYVTNQLD